jgi:hypothetical protein
MIILAFIIGFFTGAVALWQLGNWMVRKVDEIEKEEEEKWEKLFKEMKNNSK